MLSAFREEATLDVDNGSRIQFTGRSVRMTSGQSQSLSPNDRETLLHNSGRRETEYRHPRIVQLGADCTIEIRRHLGTRDLHAEKSLLNIWDEPWLVSKPWTDDKDP